MEGKWNSILKDKKHYFFLNRKHCFGTFFICFPVALDHCKVTTVLFGFASCCRLEGLLFHG